MSIKLEHAVKTLSTATAAGVNISINGAGTLQATGDNAAIKNLAPSIKAHKKELIALLRSKNTALPYLKDECELVIPLNVPAKYRWWQDGQGILDTLLELDAPDSVIEHWIGEITSPADWRRWQKIMKKNRSPAN